MAKDAQINIRVEREDKVNIDMNAERLHMSVVEYLTALHKEYGSKMIEKYGDKK